MNLGLTKNYLPALPLLHNPQKCSVEGLTFPKQNRLNTVPTSWIFFF